MAKSKKNEESEPQPKVQLHGKDENNQKFTVGNLFSVGNTGGAPPLYKTPQEMCDKLAEYIAYEDSRKRPDQYIKEGKGIYTLEGAALFLGFSTRQSFYDYGTRKGNEEFAYIVDRFKLFLTQWNAQKLYWGGTFAGAMFWLKNWGGYKDEVTQNQNQTITEVRPQIFQVGTPLANNEADVIP